MLHSASSFPQFPYSGPSPIGAVIPQQALSRAAGDAVQIRLVGGESLWTCRVDLSQFESAMLNLVINARDAMPAGGDITIPCHNQGVAAGRPALQRDYVRVDVTDTGVGIPPHLVQRVFEPFFTTKPVGQ